MLTRRDVIAGMSGALLVVTASNAPVFGASPRGRLITARAGKASLLEDPGKLTDIWGYDASVPGPELRAQQGKPFAVRLANELSQPTTIHWHGVRIKNAMDGVAGLTQPPVDPGATFDYRFIPPDAGTYWYHPHNRTWEQLARGLQGAFIVEEENPPAFDQDIALVFDDWRLQDHGPIHEKSFGSLHDKSHAGRLGNVLTLNGKPAADVPVRAGERLRIRLINTSNARIMGIVFDGHTPFVIALDGQPVLPFAPKQNMVVLGPAQRADLLLDCDQDIGARTKIIVDVGRERLHLGDLVYHRQKRTREKTLSDIVQLPQNPMPTALDPLSVQKIDLVMTGGARSRFEGAIYKGQRYAARELVREHGMTWALNGIAAMSEEPLGKFAIGETIHIRMSNQTSWPHAMHFHGHHVREVAHSKRQPHPHWRDTILMQANEELTVAFQAHNPGKWMLHCHMLEHQAGGMATWYQVG